MEQIRTSIQIREYIEDTNYGQDTAVKLSTLSSSKGLVDCRGIVLSDVSLLRDCDQNTLGTLLSVYGLSVPHMLRLCILVGVHDGVIPAYELAIASQSLD